MIKKSSPLFIIFLILVSFTAEARKLNTGPWKFILRTTNADIPFIINFTYKGKNLRGTLENGEEKIPLRGIKHEKNMLFIPLQAYELSLELSLEDKETLIGYLVRHNKNPKVKTPVTGIFAKNNERYHIKKAKAFIDLTGKWALQLKDGNGVISPGIANLKQVGNRFSGSILTPTGDYRYIEGHAWENRFEAASFDGVYNYVFKGSLENEKMVAEIGSNSMTKISGLKDPKATLPDPYKQTKIKELKFIFPDLKGQNVSLNHTKFKGKPVIIQIYGSWCPNCLDEMNYFIPWYNENAKRGVEIIALAFERSLSSEDATKQLLKVQKKFKVPYTILKVGSTSEDKPADKLPGLKNFISFPTTIFLDKNHRVIKVHAGFSGPSTGEFFEKWKIEFNQTVDGLLK